jgi:N-acetylneuraminic acid mutarotase
MKRIVHVLYSGLGGHGSVFFSLAKSDTAKEFSTGAVFCGIEKVREDYVKQCTELHIPFRAVQKNQRAETGYHFFAQYLLYNPGCVVQIFS